MRDLIYEPQSCNVSNRVNDVKTPSKTGSP